MLIEKNVTLQIGGSNRFVSIPVSQFDTMWRFVFEIIHNNVAWEIPTGATAVLNGRKPDGNVFAFSGTIVDNKVTVDCDVQMTAVAGKTDCELSILSDGKVVGTANFVMDVEAAPKSPSDVSSESTLPAYQEMLDVMANIPYDIHGSVEDWLDAHPEATTTVQDGAITDEKIVDGAVTWGKLAGGVKSRISANTGISEQAVTLLVGILRTALYSTNQSANIDLLEEALLSGNTDAIFQSGETLTINALAIDPYQDGNVLNIE